MLTPDLTQPAVIKELLQQVNAAPSHAAGQNFLTCREVVDATLLVTTAGPSAITELGAGLGVLTAALLADTMRVRAIERDQTLADILAKVIPPKDRDRLTLVRDDLRHVDWTWPEPYQVVGNIPYNLSGLIIRRLTQLAPAPTTAVLLVQREVGERLTATPPDMSLLSLAVQLWGSATRLMNVPAHCFWPQPKVHSQLVALVPHTDAATTTQHREAILATAKPFFQAKRKQIGGVLRRQYALTTDQVDAISKQAGITPTQRPQELTPDQWTQVHHSLTTHTNKDEL